MALALARRGHHVTVACYAHGQGDVDPDYDVVRTPAVPGYDNLRAGPDLIKPALDLALAAQLVRLGRRADVVHAHNYEAPVAAYLARALTGVPVVYNNHNTMGEELHRYFQGARAQRLAHHAGRVMDAQIPRRADASVAISEQAVTLLRDLGCHPVHYVPPGVDMGDFEGADAERARAAHGLGDRVWVVYAGNPDSYQDLEVLVDAVCAVPDVGLLMVSASPLDEWQERARSLPQERKRFVVTPEWGQVRDLIAAADIAALPRAVCSGYPIKLLNYLGLGKPTVACQGSARPIPGVVAVPNGDPAAFGAALVELAVDPERTRALGLAACGCIARDYTWDAQAAKLERVYAQVLAGRAVPRR
jgi:glycosyltransferase involved in cell wall biosynthesis